MNNGVYLERAVTQKSIIMQKSSVQASPRDAERLGVEQNRGVYPVTTEFQGNKKKLFHAVPFTSMGLAHATNLIKSVNLL